MTLVFESKSVADCRSLAGECRFSTADSIAAACECVLFMSRWIDRPQRRQKPGPAERGREKSARETDWSENELALSIAVLLVSLDEFHNGRRWDPFICSPNATKGTISVAKKEFIDKTPHLDFAWFLCLILYQLSWVIQCQKYPCRKIAEILFNLYRIHIFLALK